MFAQAIETILNDHCTPTAVRGIESGVSGAALWSTFADAGFLELLTPELEGGAELELPELFEILLLLGRHAVPVPLAQSFAARSLAASGVSLPSTMLTLAPALVRESNGTLRCPGVPFGAIARHVLAADGDRLLLLDAELAERRDTGVSRSQAATLIWQDAGQTVAIAGNAAALAPTAAAVHAALIAGSMAAVFDMTLLYCNDRQQFGRPLGKFQAVQHQLSQMAEHVAAVSIAAEFAFDTPARTPDLLRAAIAKSVASEAVPLVANMAHALHGAIGVTEEYDLQLHTRRLHEWRMAHGAEPYWQRIVGNAVLAADGTLSNIVQRL